MEYDPESEGWGRDGEMQVLGGWIGALGEAVVMLAQETPKKDHVIDSLRAISENNNHGPTRFAVATNHPQDWREGVEVSMKRKLLDLADRIEGRAASLHD